MSNIPRKPPPKVVKKLRKEVGFSCPVPGCSNPYLTWHHFDPPWRELHHQNPSGMVALCVPHANKADVGTYTKKQVRAFKKNPSLGRVAGSFDWLRNDLLVSFGEQFSLNPKNILTYRNEKLISCERDRKGRLLLNLSFPKEVSELRGKVVRNWWFGSGLETDITSPPNGRILRADYKNGDMFSVEFQVQETVEELTKRHPGLLELKHGVEIVGADSYTDKAGNSDNRIQINVPTTTLEIRMIANGHPIVATSSLRGLGINIGPNYLGGGLRIN